jgi:hypothetical protein
MEDTPLHGIIVDGIFVVDELFTFCTPVKHGSLPSPTTTAATTTAYDCSHGGGGAAERVVGGRSAVAAFETKHARRSLLRTSTGWSLGDKKLLWVVVRFKDTTDGSKGTNSISSATSLAKAAADHVNVASFGRMKVTPTIFPEIIVSAEIGDNQQTDALYSEAEAAIRASYLPLVFNGTETSCTHCFSNYDMVVIDFPKTSTFSFSVSFSPRAR